MKVTPREIAKHIAWAHGFDDNSVKSGRLVNEIERAIQDARDEAAKEERERLFAEEDDHADYCNTQLSCNCKYAEEGRG